MSNYAIHQNMLLKQFREIQEQFAGSWAVTLGMEKASADHVRCVFNSLSLADVSLMIIFCRIEPFNCLVRGSIIFLCSLIYIQWSRQSEDLFRGTMSTSRVKGQLFTNKPVYLKNVLQRIPVTKK